MVVRLPRRPGAAAGVADELAVLRHVAELPLEVATPTVRHEGRPSDAFPHPWSVLGWIDGVDAWAMPDRDRPNPDLALDLARAVTTLRAAEGIAAPPRSPGRRGGPLGPVIENIDRWLAEPHAATRIDRSAVHRLADQARELEGLPVAQRFVHGDLIPGNLLVAGGRLTAIIDWGGAGRGDPAQDLAPAWSVLTAQERLSFREAVGADDAEWIRGRTFELEHAIGGVLYYEPRGHVLGDIMARTLERILEEA